MISPTDNGFSDADIKGLKLTLSQRSNTANEATTSSGFGTALVSADHNTGLRFNKDADIPEQRILPAGIWTGSPVDVKGKGIARSLDWHLATMASNNREREGSYLICRMRHCIDHITSCTPIHPLEMRCCWSYERLQK
jgi:hypothetical protein